MKQLKFYGVIQMKYKHWDEYSDAKRWEVSKKEAALETNNGTTKEDLNNIIKFLVQIADPYTTEDLEEQSLIGGNYRR